jgi:hypothetical protein
MSHGGVVQGRVEGFERFIQPLKSQPRVDILKAIDSCF